MKPDPTSSPPLDDEAIARLIGSAGPRPLIPAEDLAAIAGAARSAWEARVPAQVPEDAAEERSDAGRGASGGGSANAARGRFGARRDKGRFSRPLALAAAIFGLAIGLAAWWAARPPEPSPTEVATVEAVTGPVSIEVAGMARQITVGDPLPLGALVRTGADGDGEPRSGRAALRLDGGSIVRLDTATTIRLAAAARIEIVSGSLYADTGMSPDATTDRGGGGALEISTELGTARDIGTRFMVRYVADAEGPAVEVLVRDGAVALDRGGESVVAAAGEQLVAVGADGAIERRAVSLHGPEWAWVLDAAAPVLLEGRTFAEILEWVSRETGWTVRYEDEALAETVRRIPLEGGGAAARALRPDQAPFLLLPTARLEGILDDGVLTVRRAR